MSEDMSRLPDPGAAHKAAGHSATSQAPQGLWAADAAVDTACVHMGGGCGSRDSGGWVGGCFHAGGIFFAAPAKCHPRPGSCRPRPRHGTDTRPG